MADFIKNTVAKAAGNVTQSVTSAVIVFIITTYVLVDSGKKEEPQNSADIDTSKKGMNISPVERPVPKQRVEPLSSPANEPKQLVTGEKQNTNPEFARGKEGASAATATEAMSVSLRQPVETKKEPSPAEAQAKQDSLTKEKKQAEEMKKVKKRADDVFDELDEEVNKKPPQ
jgi:hypothetical protein